MTQSPGLTDLTEEPVATTSKHASLPGTATGTEVERDVSKGRFMGYVPWIKLISAGLIGVARVRRVMREECGGGME